MLIPGNIQVLVDNDSWILPYAEKLCMVLNERGANVGMIREHEEIEPGWCCFLLGCTSILPAVYLEMYEHVLVIHESDLPKGRGFAPMTWQILEGKNEIPVCLLEAGEEADSGKIWLRSAIRLDGTELCDDWRRMQGEKTVEMCLEFVENHDNLEPEIQYGASTSYPRRRPDDSELDAGKSLEEQFNLLRIVDNDRYPAFVNLNGQKYILRIEKDG